MYRVLLGRGGPAPALLAGSGRVDHVEVVELDSGEVVLFWELPPKDAARLLRALRADLAQLGAEVFIDAWEGADSGRY